ncbi:hypothetical protein ANO11243_018880 [Dothideomycetidae sp. 11243]|nr:hypothetical protein ANO11243_018880 [fungal sp. No.11243]
MEPDLPESAFPGIIPWQPCPRTKKHKVQDTTAGDNLSARLPNLEAEEWEDGALQDSDFAEVEQSLVDSPLENNTEARRKEELLHSTAANTTVGPSNLQRAAQPLERLPNGNWKCRHRCKDRSKCGHSCCTHGTESKPRRKPKAAKAGVTDPKAITKNAPSGGGQTQLTLESGKNSVHCGPTKRMLEQIDLSQTIFPSSAQTSKRLRLSSGESRQLDDKQRQEGSLDYAAQQGASSTQREIGDEYEGFDDVDLNLPLLSPFAEAPNHDGNDSLRCASGSGPRGYSLCEMEQDPSHGAIDDETTLSDDELLEAALVGAEDSVILGSPSRSELQPSPSAKEQSCELSSREHSQDMVSETAARDGDSQIIRDGGKASPKEGQGTVDLEEQAKMDELRLFLSEEFGDLVQLV